MAESLTYYTHNVHSHLYVDTHEQIQAPIQCGISHIMADAACVGA